MEFYVSTDRQRLENFAINVDVEGCGKYQITHGIPVPISGNSFSFTGEFYGSGTFNSKTSATGSTGLDEIYISNCGYISGGPWSWTANWVHSAQVTATGAALQDLAERADVETPFKALLIR